MQAVSTMADARTTRGARIACRLPRPMAVEGKRGAARTAPGDQQETVTVDALDAGKGDGVAGLVEMHRRVAARLLQEGAPSRAFGELVRASRAIPMTRRLAAHLVAFSLKAGTEPAAITLLQTGIDDAEGAERAHIRRQLARLLRKLRQLERAREILTAVLAENPQDRRARRVLNALLEDEARWDELDASLEKEAKDALKRAQLRRAARATLQRARVYERLENHPRAALRYAQAAQYLESAKDAAGAFDLRLLWLRSLCKAEAPKRALKDAVEVFLKAGAAADQTDRARAMLEALGLAPAGGQKVAGAPVKGRSQTQRELLLAGEVAEASGRAPEAAALFNAAVAEGPDPQILRRLEAHYVARRAWRELAQFYRARVAAARTKEEKVESLGRLAELLEDELGDLDGAARAYEEIVQLGDPGALKEQVRLLAAKQDQSAVRRAFDAAVNSATTDTARTSAFAARAEAALRKQDYARARKDFEEAVAADPSNIAARAGLAEAAAKLGDLEPIAAFTESLKKAPRRFPGRADLLRRLARLATAPLSDAGLARWAWSEVLAEVPGDEEAEDRLAELARRTGDDAALEAALARFIQREPRGPKTRLARIERVQVLERMGRDAEALAALREAVRFEPGHQQAWLLLADRLIALRQHGEAAWALEHAATATEDDLERAGIWLRAARFVRESLGDDERAATFERRAKKLQEAHAAPAAPPVVTPPPPRAAVPEDRIKTDTGGTDPDARTPSSHETVLEMETVAPPDEAEPPGEDDGSAWRDSEDRSGAALASYRDESPILVADEDVLEVTTGDLIQPQQVVEEWEAPPGQMDEGPSTVELPVPLGEGEVQNTPSLPHPALQRLRVDRARLLAQVREDPLDAGGYYALAEYFDHVGDADRKALMSEIAHALEGDPDAAPRAPRLILSATDRAGLRHPALRGEAGELLALSGVALCRAHPARGRAAGSREEFRLDAGRGAQAAGDALLAAVRILGLRAPDLYISEDNGPPFALTHTAQGTRILIGRLAVKRLLPEAELRFFAGRALFTQNPDLLALRTLKKEELARGLAVLRQVVRSGRNLSGEARAIREGLSPRAIPRIRELFERVGQELPWAALADGARHSANRAGLVVCGGVAPALQALRAKKALRSEVVELIRFAASERYLRIRNKRL